MDTFAAKTNSPDILLEERRGAAAVLTLNRPSARNSLSLHLIDTLHAAVERLGSDNDTAALVIAGSPPAFCAGHDLRELTGHRRDRRQAESLQSRVRQCRY